MHFIAFLPAIVLILIAIIFRSNDTVSELFVILGIVAFILNLINFYTSEFGITDKRIVIKTGALRKKIIDLQYGQIESIQYNQGILGGILGYGVIKITGSGGTNFKFPNISNANEFKNQAQNQLQKISETHF